MCNEAPSNYLLAYSTSLKNDKLSYFEYFLDSSYSKYTTAAPFNRAASAEYKKLDNAVKEPNLNRSQKVFMTSTDIRKRGAKIFTKIEKQVCIKVVCKA